MRLEPLRWIWFCLLAMLIANPAEARENWHTRGEVAVEAAGIVEIILPPELVSAAEDGSLDLTLTGPDGLPRSFELYWREPVADTHQVLNAGQVTLDELGRFTWEGAVPEGLVVHQLQVQLAAPEAIGRMDVEGLRQGQWQPLVQNAAVFQAGGIARAAVTLPEARYERLRLRLTGLDQRARTAVAPIREVAVTGRPVGRDYAVRAIDLPYQRTDAEGYILIDAVLPGGGLHLRSVQVETEASFQGAWQLGRNAIEGSRKTFAQVQSGRMAHVGHNPLGLTIGLDADWPGRSLVVKLEETRRYIGAITRLRAEVRLPRLVFAADQPGRYALFTGGDQKAPLLEQPGDVLRRPDREAAVTAIQDNPSWQPDPLVERFQVAGAPFDAGGYTWRTPLQISEPGYYRLALSLEAVLKSAGQPIRIVREGRQVPYILGGVEIKTIDLPVSMMLDAKKNQSQWTIQLPGASDQWRTLSLHAEGIFRRRLQWELPKVGNMGWEPWRTVQWENHDARETALLLDMTDLPPEVDHLRAVMDNGDNAPVTISEIRARYAAPTFYFLAQVPGAYLLYGGNPQAAPPQYDLSLVQDQLLATLAQETHMGKLEAFQQSGWQSRFDAAFKGSGWGLYAVLAVVTLVLVGVIVRLFPKDTK